MADIRIEHLALKLSGLSEEDGRRLGQLIAEELAAAPALTGTPRHLDSLRVDVTAPPGAGIERLAAQVMAELRRQL